MTADELRERFPSLIGRLAAEEVEAFAAALESRAFPAGERLVVYGETARTLFLVVDGTVSVHVEKDGEDLLLGQAGPGAVVGEIGLIDPGPATATLEAIEPVETLALDHQRFEVLCGEHPAVASALLRAFSLEIVDRLRDSTHEIVRRIDDHHWMRVRAREERHGWRDRIAALVRGRRREGTS